MPRARAVDMIYCIRAHVARDGSGHLPPDVCPLGNHRHVQLSSGYGCRLELVVCKLRLGSGTYMYVCVFVCLPASISPEPHARSSPQYLHVLPMAVARSSLVGVVICYVLPVL